MTAERLAAASARGASGRHEPAFSRHPGFSRIFAPGALTVGLFLPLWPYRGNFHDMAGQGKVILAAERAGWGALWLRDVPLQTGPRADVGQVHDPWTYAGWLAAKTERITIATGSVIVTVRHPIDVAKQAATLDRLSGGRLVLGIAAGDRAEEFPAYGVDPQSVPGRFRDAVGLVRTLFSPGSGPPPGGTVLLPKPGFGSIPLLVTGRAGQDEAWVAAHADGWLTYPGPTATAEGPRRLGEKIERLRSLVPDDRFLPVVTNEWIDLATDPEYPPTPLDGGRVLRTGTDGLITLLEQWRRAGVNHGALGIQHGTRPAAEVIAQISEAVLPAFPVHSSAEPPAAPVW
jgi:luciferase-type oxidoreductase